MEEKPLSEEGAGELLKGLTGWALAPGAKALRREWVMEDFAAAIALIDRIAETAETMDHHPDLHLTGYRRLVVELSTHSAGGLTSRDFALAAEIERLPKRLRVG